MCGTEHPNVNCHRVAAAGVGSGRHLDYHFMIESKVREIVTQQVLNKTLELEFTERMEDKEQEYSREETKFLKIVREFVTRKIIMKFPFLSAITDSQWFSDNREEDHQKHYAHRRSLLTMRSFTGTFDFMSSVIAKGLLARDRLILFLRRRVKSST